MMTQAVVEQATILVVDDDPAIRDSLEEILEDSYDVVCVDSGADAVEQVRSQVFDLVFLDIVMPGMDGIETLKRIKAVEKDLDVIMISGIDRAQQATESIRQGAYDYITKPFDHEVILNRLEKVLETRSLNREVHYHRAQAEKGEKSTNIVSRSSAMAIIFDIIDKVSQASSSVLITGESGTGKELVARTIHNKSSRASRPFVAINCAAMPRELMESELFGYEKGAFTGAHKQSRGKFEFAHQGSIFLDEISCLEPEFQAKLLRVLQEREFTRVGSNRIVKVDVRVIAATNIHLTDMVKDGSFREDLYFRLNVVPVELPPLRQRTGDVPLLAKFFLERLNQKMNRNVAGITPSAMSALDGYNWPGNVRELENLLERMVVLTPDDQSIDLKNLPFEILFSEKSIVGAKSSLATGRGLIQARTTFERLYILKALQDNHWNQTRTARQLDIHRNTLIQKMKSLDLKNDDTQ
ncbi:DNA-binding transcriptional response regulator, NtrC family, contains REC, AAA-type ATPase, and a Fis-type DNA-binding domains [Desulfocicer vacuolatum DSM 3385]|uniref:DNA-binding transcriptional response regulator, NtrC family, contains REC, AAA-type ATPase, and a Fis-type DNA-binding domains n=1 Tax=Desulfocicer vacuolatum DSM 3385 TaxID=1121400 RepID=A0A1W2CYZ6_9BACT|nr:sigma-54 dependent transcriptional regulator [Desulfocicer vacuolatum]SMC90497.1 DNA-binding transcriptional response regulator, NtrC family, contains REC, AAA-type ATPase, and a Fis-type DNA-binding domains [Desulfocicer vacuolatum DSM 3385]